VLKIFGSFATLSCQRYFKEPIMSQRHPSYIFGVLFLGVMSLCDAAKAQYPYAPPPAIDYLKPEQIRPDLYGPNGSDPAPRFRRSPDQAPSGGKQQPTPKTNSGVQSPLPANPSPQLRAPLPDLQTGFVLTDNTPIKLRFKETISSKTAQENQVIEFEVAEDVVLKGITVISRGAIAKGIIAEVKRARMLGRRGKINIILKEVQIASGERVALRASTGKGGGLSGGTIALSAVITPLFLLMGGKEAKYKAGTEFAAFIDGDYVLDKAKFSGPAAPMAPKL
jgi:hypothetical protein